MPLDRTAFRHLVSFHTSPKMRVTDVTCVTASDINDLRGYTSQIERVTCVTGSRNDAASHDVCNPKRVSCVTEEPKSEQSLNTSGYTVTRLHTKNAPGKNQAADAASVIDPADWLAHFEERAAIREYDGGLPRGEAERLALADTETALGPCPEGRSS